MNQKWSLYLTIYFLLCTTTLQAAINPCPRQNPYHLLVNRQHPISPDYQPSQLVIPQVTFQSPGNLEKNYMEKEAAHALETMFAAAHSQGIRLVAISGYRSYTRQSVLYRNAVAASGIGQKGTAKPGQSEHQTGLAMDVNSISQAFQYTKEGKWLAEHAHLYGFIIRYPKGKTAVTGYMYEPWHIRYVGTELAKQCFTSGLTLEEITNCCPDYETPTLSVDSFTQPIAQPYSLLRLGGVTYMRVRELMTLIKSVSVDGPSA